MKLKKLLAVVLSVALAVTMIPAFAMSAGAKTSDESAGETKAINRSDNNSIYTSASTSYTVTIEQSAYGGIIPTLAIGGSDTYECCAGDVDKVFVYANRGYKITAVYLTHENGTKDKLDFIQGDGAYKLVMPAENVKLSATYEKKKSIYITKATKNRIKTFLKSIVDTQDSSTSDAENEETLNEIVTGLADYVGEWAYNEESDMFTPICEYYVNLLGKAVEVYSGLSSERKKEIDERYSALFGNVAGFFPGLYASDDEQRIATCIQLSTLLLSFLDAVKDEVDTESIYSNINVADLFCNWCIIAELILDFYNQENWWEYVDVSEIPVTVHNTAPEMYKGIINDGIINTARSKIAESIQTKKDVTVLTTWSSVYTPISMSIIKNLINDDKANPDDYELDISKVFKTYLIKTGEEEAKEIAAEEAKIAEYEKTIESLQTKITDLQETISKLESEGKVSTEELESLKLQLTSYKEKFENLLKDSKINVSAFLGDDGAVITWDKVGTEVTGTEVYALNENGEYDLVDTVTGTTTTVKDIAPSYKIRQYVEVSGEKFYSSEKVITPALSTPKNVKVTKGKRTLTVKWSKVPAAQQYKVYYKTSGSKAKYKTVNAPKTKVTLKKLKKGKTYTVKVKAIYEVGALSTGSAWSKAKKAKVR